MPVSVPYVAIALLLVLSLGLLAILSYHLHRDVTRYISGGYTQADAVRLAFGLVLVAVVVALFTVLLAESLGRYTP